MSALPIKTPRWIEWRAVKRKDGKVLKTPFDPIGARKLNAYAERDFWPRAKIRPDAKPGFVLGMIDDDSAIVGIDLDTCLSKSGKLEPWAREALDEWGSYAEVSPSKTGVKAFARVDAATFKKLRKQLDGVRRTWAIGAGEHPPGIMLALGGYFAVTDDALDSAKLRTIDLDCVQRVIEIGERIQVKAQKDAGVEGTGWNDETGSGESWRLAVETRRGGGSFEDYAAAVEENPDALRSLEDSPRGFDGQLERDWERASSKVDKEESSVVEKFEDHGDDEDDSNSDDESDFITAEALAALPRPFDFLEGLLYEQQTSIVYGAPKAGKSFLMLDMACAIGLGRRWAGRECDARKVLVIPLEGRGTIIDRVRAWERKHKAKCPLIFRLKPLDLINDRKAVRAIIKYVKKHKIGLVIIDTLSRAIPSAEENSATDMGKAVQVSDSIARAGAHVMFLHHSNKQGTMRGSNVLIGAPDLVLKIMRQGDQREVMIEENRHGRDGERMHFTLEPCELDMKDARGKSIESATVKLSGEWFEDVTEKEGDDVKLTELEDAALRILTPEALLGPMSKDQARDLLKRKGWTHKPDADAATLKKARQRVLTSLEKKGFIECDSNDEVEIAR